MISFKEFLKLKEEVQAADIAPVDSKLGTKIIRRKKKKQPIKTKQ